MNFEEFKKLARAKSFVELYQHYFRLFLIMEGYFSKNLSYSLLHKIVRGFCEMINFPSDILEGLKASEIDIDTLRIMDNGVLDMMSQISEEDIVRAFSQLTLLKTHSIL